MHISSPKSSVGKLVSTDNWQAPDLHNPYESFCPPCKSRIGANDAIADGSFAGMSDVLQMFKWTR